MVGVNEERHISERGCAFIAMWEGYSPVSYKDEAGNLTIGFGHKVKPDEKFASSINKIDAYKILQSDLQYAEVAVKRVVNVPLSQSQYDALVSFVFNVGDRDFKNSTLLKLLNAGKYSKAADEFARWCLITVRGKKTECPGLIARRSAEKIVFSKQEIISH